MCAGRNLLDMNSMNLLSKIKRGETGFTLLEALIALAVISIVLGLAAPSFTQLIARNRVDSAVNMIAQAFSLARAEAVARNLAVSLCPLSGSSCGGDWTQGTLVFVDENENGVRDVGDVRIEQTATNFPQLTITANNFGNSVTYFPDGSVSINGSVRVCDSNGYGMQLTVNAVGRPRLEDASAVCP